MDEAFNNEANLFAIGFVLLGPNNRHWGGGFHQIKPHETVMNAKLQAIKDGLTFWKEHNPEKVKVLSDSIDDIHVYSWTRNIKALKKQVSMNPKKS